MATEAQNIPNHHNGPQNRESSYLRAYKAPLHLSRTLYKSALFMQNKANFRKSQMNVSIFSQKAYGNKSNWTLGENKPKTNPNKANFRKAQMNVSSLITKDYRKNDAFAVQKNKPNSNPIRTQSKPILERMNVHFCATGYYESKPTFAANNPNVEITTAWSCGASPSPSLMGWARIVA